MSNTLTTPPFPVDFDTELLKKLSTQHSALQQMWLSGYLYGVALQGQVAPPQGYGEILPAEALQQQTSIAEQKVTILFGSQTGNSKKVAHQIGSSIRESSWEVAVTDLNDYPSKQLKNEQIVLLVVSTQGEGDPPVAAEEFHQWLLSSRAPNLEGVKFAVCALGDKSYLQFCQTGKEFDARFEALGATRLIDRVDCDVDFEEIVAVWIGRVLEQLSFVADSAAGMGGTISATNGHHSLEHPAAKAADTVKFDRKHPFNAQILEKIQLNGRGAQKETWHLELSLQGSGLLYEPGDSLGIYPQNPPSLVREVLYAAMLNGNKTVVFNEKENSLRHFLLREVELSEGVATRRHLRVGHVARIPRGQHQTTSGMVPRVGLHSRDVAHEVGNLIDRPVRSLPATPLLAVDRPEFAGRVRPRIPDVNLGNLDLQVVLVR